MSEDKISRARGRSLGSVCSSRWITRAWAGYRSETWGQSFPARRLVNEMARSISVMKGESSSTMTIPRLNISDCKKIQKKPLNQSINQPIDQSSTNQSTNQTNRPTEWLINQSKLWSMEPYLLSSRKQFHGAAPGRSKLQSRRRRSACEAMVRESLKRKTNPWSSERRWTRKWCIWFTVLARD